MIEFTSRQAKRACESSVKGLVRPYLAVFSHARIARRLEDRELGRSCCSAIESLLACYTTRQIKIESANFLMFVCRCWMKLAPGCLSAPFNISCFISCMLASVTCENNTKLCRKTHMKILTNCKNNPTFPSLCDWRYTDDKEIEQFSTERQKVIQNCTGFLSFTLSKIKTQQDLVFWVSSSLSIFEQLLFTTIKVSCNRELFDWVY